MNVALMGSVSSSVYCLEALVRGGVEITCVLGLDASQAGAVSDYHSLEPIAIRAGLPFRGFQKVDEPAVEAFLRAHTPDMLWVIGLSQLVPESLIRIAPHGGVGFHPTMLPKGRGRAPVAWTILRGEKAAVSLFYLSDEPDAGDIIAQREVPVLPDDYSEDLIHRTNESLTEVVLELAPRIRSGKIPRTPQNHGLATFYPKRTPADGLIDWSATTDEIYRLVRAVGRPYPGAFTHAQGRKLTIWRATPVQKDAIDVQRSREDGSDPPSASPGTVLRVDADGGTLVRTGDGTILLTQIEREDDGNRAMDEIVRVGNSLSMKPKTPENSM